MVTSSCTLLLLLLAVRGSIQKSVPTSLTYRAAVVELKSIEYTNDAAKTLNDNAMKTVSFIEQAAQREADIVVFPEMGLSSLTLGTRLDLVSRSTLVPDPAENYAPCTNSTIPVIESLKKIACAIERNNIYVVVNLLEKELCSMKDCPSDGMFVYITSVAFDRKGQIIARSRKAHLVDEYKLLQVMQPPELSIFDTDFGVRFGSVVCFDIMFENTLVALTREHNITDIVHSSGWYSMFPFLTTIQMSAGWAYAEDINLLSAGYNHMEWGNSGSGIYAGRQGVVSAILPANDHEELLVADLLKKPQKTAVTPIARNNDEHHLRPPTPTDVEYRIEELLPLKNSSEYLRWKYHKLNGSETKVIAENGFTVQRLSHVGIDCEFQVNVTNLTPLGVTYRAIALDGNLRYSDPCTTGMRICAIVLCANNTIDSCGHVRHTSVILNSIKITATYVDNAKTILMPNTLRSDMMPLKDFTWEQYEQGERIHTSISLTKPTQDLITFGIWGRNFERDIELLA